MADIAVESSGGQRLSGGDPTVSTVVSSADHVIVAIVTSQDSNTNNLGASSVTRDGQSFTKRIEAGGSGGSGQPNNIQIWYLTTPNVGTADTVADCNGSINECTLTVAVLSSVDVASLIAGEDSDTDNGFAPDLSVTVASDKCLLIGGMCSESEITGIGSGQTQLQSFTDQSYENTRTSYELVGAAGSHSHSYNMNNGAPYAEAVIALKNLVAASTAVKDIISFGMIASPR